MYNSVRLKSIAKLQLSFSSLLCHRIHESLWWIWIGPHVFRNCIKFSELAIRFVKGHLLCPARFITGDYDDTNKSMWVHLWRFHGSILEFKWDAKITNCLQMVIKISGMRHWKSILVLACTVYLQILLKIVLSVHSNWLSATSANKQKLAHTSIIENLT